uniref:Uncharacterized protein n=1 Tax=Catharus ustulatus TaxID=91951 RepID=A0A8C3UX03_CATUS
MNREELTYLSVLLGSIPVGFVLKDRGPRCRQLGGAALGAGLALLTCGPHVLHSLGTVLGTWAILGLLPRWVRAPNHLGGVLDSFGVSLIHFGVSLSHLGGSLIQFEWSQIHFGVSQVHFRGSQVYSGGSLINFGGSFTHFRRSQIHSGGP